ncbi:hypothetical protein FRC12_021625 [Ceratobasidium sp. 428]|nr:hypothetical protein FRC12_021625 [Ceratobasidium sp. 428]
MSWFGKKKPNPEDGDFPHVSKHYREEKTPTRTINIVPPLPWSGTTTVVWGIDIGAGATTVSFAYLDAGRDVEVHNIIYWPKEFPLRESSASGLPLPDVKSNKTFKMRETYPSIGFVSHPTWPSEKTANYLYTASSTTTSSAFQIRTEVPFLESSERHKFNDLVEQLLKHALGVYGAVVKPTQPHWPQASEVIVTLPSGLPKSAEITITGVLDRAIISTMPNVIGPTRIFYVRRPDVRLFEDDLWRNIDTNFHNGDVFMLVDWNMTSGDMVCASYKAIQLSSGQMAFGTRLRSYIQALPLAAKRDAAIDEREGVRFANALHWCAINKHRVQKLIVRTSNPIKKPDNLLAIFHKSLTDGELQVGLRPVDPSAETGAFGAAVWYIAHAIARNQHTEGGELTLVPDMTQLLSGEVEPNLPQPSFSLEKESPSRVSRALTSLSMGVLGRANRQSVIGSSPLGSPPDLSSTSALLIPPLSTPTLLTPINPNPPTSDPSPPSIQSPQTPRLTDSSSSAAVNIAHTPSIPPGPSNSAHLAYPEADEVHEVPPAYTDGPGRPRNLHEKHPGGGYSDHQGVASHDYEARDDNEISFNEGERIANIETIDKDWWRGTNARGETGLFPAKYVISKETMLVISR